MGRSTESEFFIDNLQVRIHFIIVMIRRTGLAPWEFEFPFPGSLTRARIFIEIMTNQASGDLFGVGAGDNSVRVFFFFFITLKASVE